jgi:hypothetical protein
LLHDVTAALLQSHGQSVSLLEGTTTGGQLAVWFTESPAAPAVLHESLVLPDWDTSDLAGWPQLIRDLMSGYSSTPACLQMGPALRLPQEISRLPVVSPYAEASWHSPQPIHWKQSTSACPEIWRFSASKPPRTALNLLRRRLLVNAD